MAGQNPAGAPGAFDMSQLQKVMEDESIKGMAEAVAADPSFQAFAQQLQQSMGGMGLGDGASGAPGAAPADGAANPMHMFMQQMQGMSGGAADGSRAAPGGAPAGPGGAEGFDPATYMNAMQGLLGNPEFVDMAEKLGQQILQQEPEMGAMMKAAQDPQYKAQMEEKMADLKKDPELADILSQLETGGPMAMMKYWNDPAVLQKLNGAFAGGMPGFPTPGAAGAGSSAAEPPASEPAEEEPEDENTVHGAASSGNLETLKKLIAEKAPLDEKDDEGRTGLHFAAGYGEIECVKALLEAGAKVDEVDSNKNTALHYAAGYGQAEVVKMLMEDGSSTVAKNADDKTPLEVARLNNQEEVVKIMDEVFTL